MDPVLRGTQRSWIFFSLSHFLRNKKKIKTHLWQQCCVKGLHVPKLKMHVNYIINIPLPSSVILPDTIAKVVDRT